MNPLSLEFNAAVYAMAARVCPAGYDVSATAPATYEDLRDYVDAKRRICVWNGAVGEDKTIYADKEINYAFRAWHDWTHYTYGHDFSDRGEFAVFQQQRRDLAKVFGRSFARRMMPLLHAEVVGSLDYKNVHGEWPTNQRVFVEAYLADPNAAVAATF